MSNVIVPAGSWPSRGPQAAKRVRALSIVADELLAVARASLACAEDAVSTAGRALGLNFFNCAREARESR